MFLFDDFIDVPQHSLILDNQELRKQMNYLRSRTTLLDSNMKTEAPKDYLFEVFEKPLLEIFEQHKAKAQTNDIEYFKRTFDEYMEGIIWERMFSE